MTLTDAIYLGSDEWQEHDIGLDWIVGLTFSFQMTKYKYIHPKLPQLPTSCPGVSLPIQETSDWHRKTHVLSAWPRFAF